MPNPSKIHFQLQERLAHRGFAATGPLPVIVRYKEPGATATRGAHEVRARAAESIPGLTRPKRQFKLVPAVSYAAHGRAIAALSERADVEMVWYDARVHAKLDVSAGIIQAPRVWSQGNTAHGIRVGVCDTGADAEHPDLRERVIAHKDFTGEGAGDYNGHGTHVAGIIASSGAASQGRYRGIAPAALLVIAKVLGRDGSGSMSDVMAGIEWIVDQGCVVGNLSLGSDDPSDGTDPLSVLCDEAVKRGLCLCVAAGNAGSRPGSIGAPAAARLVIAVGASTKDDEVAEFSSRGPTLDGRDGVSLLMPGVNIVSTWSKLAPKPAYAVGAAYAKLSGTSMASPHAAAAAALVLAHRPELAPAQVRDLMMRSAADLGCPAQVQGRGRGDVWAATELAPAPAPAPAGPGCDFLYRLFHGHWI